MQLRQHQQDNLNFWRKPGMARGFSMLPYGAGKSPLMVLRAGDLCPPGRVLLVTTNGTVFKWAKEFLTWGRDGWKIVKLVGTKDQRIRNFKSAHDVAIINYDGVRVMRRELGDKFAKHYDVVMLDEIHRLKNPETHIAIDCAWVAHPRWTSHVYAATGSPVLESPLDIFSIMRVVNSSVFGEDFDAWRDRYFEYKPVPRADGKKGYPKWQPKTGATDFLSDELYKISFRREREKLDMDFPVQKFNDPRVVRLTGRASKLYYEAEKKFLLALAHGAQSLSAIYPRLEKLCQISRGWVYDSNKVAYILNPQDAILALAEWLEEIRGQGRPVIWCVRGPDIALVGGLLNSMGYTYRAVHGQIRGLKKRQRMIDEFNTGHYDALICHPACVGEGIDLIANFSFRFSYRWSAVEWGQPLGRFRSPAIFKGGFKPKEARWTSFTDLVVADTVDEGIIQALRDKKDIADIVNKTKTLPWRMGVVEEVFGGR